MKVTSCINHGMYQDAYNYAAMVNYQSTLSPNTNNTNVSTTKENGKVLKVEKVTKATNYYNNKRNFPKKMLKR